jgi:hypothetical protein
MEFIYNRWLIALTRFSVPHQIHFSESDESELEGVNDNFRDFPFHFPEFFDGDDPVLEPPAAALAKIANSDTAVASVKSGIYLLAEIC